MAGPWEQYQFTTPSDEPAGPWTKYQAPAAPEETRAAPITSGEKQAVSDVALLAKERGKIPDELKTALYSAGESGAFSLPTYAAAKISQKPGQSFEDALNEQRAYIEALQRQHPTASKIGTGTGFAAGMLMPLGPLGTAGTKAAQLAARMGAGATGKAIASGATIGTGLGALSGAAEKYGTEEFTPEEIAKSSLYGGLFGGAFAPAAEKIVGKLIPTQGITTVDPVTGATKLTDAALEKTRQIFGGRLGDAELAALEPHLADVYSKTGGVSEAGAKQALLKSQGIEEPGKAMVTGTVTPETVDLAKASKEKAQQKALDIVGEMKPAGVSAEDAIRAVHEAEQARLTAGQAAFEKQKAMEGIFEPMRITMDNPQTGKTEVREIGLQDMIFPEIKNSITSGGHPTNFETAGLDQSKKAYNYLQDVFLGDPKTPGEMSLPYGGNLDVKNVMKVRNVLNGYYKGAEGNDYKALGAIIEGYDNAVNKALDWKLFTGDAAELARAKEANNAFWKKYMEDFYPRAGEERAKWRGILKSIEDPKTGYVSEVLTPGMEQAGQYAINNAIVNEKDGMAIYSRLKQAIGPDTPGMDALNASIRNNIFKFDESKPMQGQLNQISKNIDAYLRPSTLPITLQAFGAKEGDAAATAAAHAKVAELKNLGEAIRVINASPETEMVKQSKIIGLFRNAIMPMTGALVGLSHGAPTSAIGYILGHLGSNLKRGYSAASEAAAERAGAPRVLPEGMGGEGMKVPGLPYPIYPGVRNVGAAILPDEEPNYQMPPTVPVSRATGGRVMTHTDLMNAMEKAGKKDVQNTKPLLKVSDTEIAKALEIANQHI